MTLLHPPLVNVSAPAAAVLYSDAQLEGVGDLLWGELEAINRTIVGNGAQEKLLQLALGVRRKCHCVHVKLDSTLAEDVPNAVCVRLCLDDVDDWCGAGFWQQRQVACADKLLLWPCGCPPPLLTYI